MSFLKKVIQSSNPTKGIVNCVNNKDTMLNIARPSSICNLPIINLQVPFRLCYLSLWAHFAAQSTLATLEWLLNFGVSHHVATHDLQNHTKSLIWNQAC